MRNVETETAPDQVANKAWVKPRLESADIAGETRTGSGNDVDNSGGGAGTCIS